VKRSLDVARRNPGQAMPELVSAGSGRSELLADIPAIFYIFDDYK